MVHPHSEAARVLGDRIRTRRNELGISQLDLADLVGMHSSNIGKIERGEANPTLHSLVRIAVTLEIDPGMLVSGLGADSIPEHEHQLTAREFLRARDGRAGAAAQESAAGE